MSDISIRLNNDVTANLIKIESKPFNTVKDAEEAAKKRTGNEVIVQNDDGSFSLYEMDKKNEAQILSMAKKGNTSDFDPKIVGFMKSEFLQEKKIEVHDSGFQVDLGGKIKGANIKDFVSVDLANEAKDNKFSSLENAKEAAKVRGDSITAVVLNDDLTYSLYEVDRDPIKAQQQMNSILNSAQQAEKGEFAYYNEKVMCFVENKTSLLGTKTSNTKDVAGYQNIQTEVKNKKELSNLNLNLNLMTPMLFPASLSLGLMLNSNNFNLSLFNDLKLDVPTLDFGFKPQFGFQQPSLDTGLQLNTSLFGEIQKPTFGFNSSLTSMLGGINLSDIPKQDDIKPETKPEVKPETKSETKPETKPENFFKLDATSGNLGGLNTEKLDTFIAEIKNIDITKYKDVLGKEISDMLNPEMLDKMKTLLNDPTLDSAVKAHLNASLFALTGIVGSVKSGMPIEDVKASLDRMMGFPSVDNNGKQQMSENSIGNLVKDLNFGINYVDKLATLKKDGGEAMSLSEIYKICNETEQAMIRTERRQLQSQGEPTNTPIIIPRENLFKQVETRLNAMVIPDRTSSLNIPVKDASGKETFVNLVDDKKFIEEFKKTTKNFIDTLPESQERTNLINLLENKDISPKDLINSVYTEFDKMSVKIPKILNNFDKSIVNLTGRFSSATIDKASELGDVLKDERFVDNFVGFAREIATGLPDGPEKTNLINLLENKDSMNPKDLINSVYAEIEKISAKKSYLDISGHFNKSIVFLAQATKLSDGERAKVEEMIRNTQDAISLLSSGDNKNIQSIKSVLGMYERTLSDFLQKPSNENRVKVEAMKETFTGFIQILNVEYAKAKADGNVTDTEKNDIQKLVNEKIDKFMEFFNTLNSDKIDNFRAIAEKFSQNPEIVNKLCKIYETPPMIAASGRNLATGDGSSVGSGKSLATGDGSSVGSGESNTGDASVGSGKSLATGDGSSVESGKSNNGVSMIELSNQAKETVVDLLKDEGMNALNKFLSSDVMLKQFTGMNELSALTKELSSVTKEFNNNKINLFGSMGISSEAVKSVGDDLAKEGDRLLELHDINNEYMGVAVNDLIKQAAKLAAELDLSVNVEYTTVDLLKSFRDIIAKLDIEMRSANRDDVAGRAITEAFLTYLKENKEEQKVLDLLREKLLNLDVTKGLPSNTLDIIKQMSNFLNKVL